MNRTAQERALIAGVARDPHNRASYLVYADWLEERGQEERAAFLRLRAGALGLLRDDDTLN